MIGVFARADHPQGWGFVARGEAYGRAHGYSIMLVRCTSLEEMTAVTRKLAFPGTDLPDGPAWDGGSKRQAQWYSGRFDLVFCFEGAVLPGLVTLDPNGRRILSVGDNRCVSFFDAGDVLDEEPVLHVVGRSE